MPKRDKDNEQPEDQERMLEYGFEPGPNDVICQRGRNAYAHNLSFREMLSQHVPNYQRSRHRAEKSLRIMALVELVRQRGAFVRHCKKTKRWFDIGDSRAREKVGHAFREALAKKEGNNQNSWETADAAAAAAALKEKYDGSSNKGDEGEKKNTDESATEGAASSTTASAPPGLSKGAQVFREALEMDVARKSKEGANDDPDAIQVRPSLAKEGQAFRQALVQEAPIKAWRSDHDDKKRAIVNNTKNSAASVVASTTAGEASTTTTTNAIQLQVRPSLAKHGQAFRQALVQEAPIRAWRSEGSVAVNTSIHDNIKAAATITLANKKKQGRAFEQQSADNVKVSKQQEANQAFQQSLLRSETRVMIPGGPAIRVPAVAASTTNATKRRVAPLPDFQQQEALACQAAARAIAARPQVMPWGSNSRGGQVVVNNSNNNTVTQVIRPVVVNHGFGEAPGIHQASPTAQVRQAPMNTNSWRNNSHNAVAPDVNNVNSSENGATLIRVSQSSAAARRKRALPSSTSKYKSSKNNTNAQQRSSAPKKRRVRQQLPSVKTTTEETVDNEGKTRTTMTTSTTVTKTETITVTTITTRTRHDAEKQQDEEPEEEPSIYDNYEEEEEEQDDEEEDQYTDAKEASSSWWTAKDVHQPWRQEDMPPSNVYSNTNIIARQTNDDYSNNIVDACRQTNEYRRRQINDARRPHSR